MGETVETLRSDTHAGFDKLHMYPSESNSTAKGLASTFPLELSEMCFDASPKNSGPGLVLREKVESGGFVFPGVGRCLLGLMKLILSLCL